MGEGLTRSEIEIDDLDAQSRLNSLDLPELPSDCLFGDGGAHDMIQESSSQALSSESSKVTSSSNPPLNPVSSFATLFTSSDRKFTLGSGNAVLKIHDGVNAESKSLIATVYSDDEMKNKLGSISTAEPLSQTTGLKAICEVHKTAKTKPCSCWVRYSKKTATSDSQRLDLVKSLCDWLASGAGQSRETHEVDSENLRLAAGMKIRKASGP